ncbi:FecR family protein [Pedobacter sp. ISL-68]|uniref:FecR family protein n=1 Tax=unclassified Pedobacter TaxID=2628915 RepID=UPI001BE68837|nr:MULTISPECIES: FecR family protein [unclassified Pedobacter]MBT2559837.1 FecR family protein [Pedobacter sp. ISL-64]MBT2592142.1 FecR family protein [Pedobacter sp. ISL-68]
MEDNENIKKGFSPDQEERAWQNILTGIRANERKKKLRRLRIYSTVAATILLAIVGLIGYNTFFKPEVYLATSQNSEIKLADGSIVILLKGGKLTVEKSFPSDTREVFLKGDAIFKVAKSKEHPFIVHANGYETKVLGTVFKVSQSGKTFKVDLFEGKVLVYRNELSKEPIVLKPQQTFTNLGIPEAASVTATKEMKSASITDKSASLIFKECPVKDVFKVIEKTYGISINYPPDLENKKITTTSTDATAEVAVHIQAFYLNLKFKQTNDSIFELEK